MATLGVALVFSGGLLLYWTWRTPIQKRSSGGDGTTMLPAAPGVQPPGVPVLPVLPGLGRSGQA